MSRSGGSSIQDERGIDDVGSTASCASCEQPVAIVRSSSEETDRASRWLAASMGALAVLALAAAVVSYSAQYRMVDVAKRSVIAAAIEAGIPDVAALIFAALGIALALHGKRAIRPRVLNVCAVGTSVTMNVLAAGHGWRDLAIWVMPPIAYALASDTAIGVVRAWTIARQRALREALADDQTSPLAIVGGLLLWILRLALAPGSTVSGFRCWVVEECPIAPGRKAVAGHLAPRRPTPASPGSRPSVTIAEADQRQRSATTGRQTKTQRFLALVADRHGPLTAFPLDRVSRVCAELAPEVGLNTGAARTALRRHVLAAQNGKQS